MRNQFSKIQSYGKRYIKDFLSENKGRLLRDPYGALLFFYSKVFYRGRRDEVSTVFKDRTVEVLDSVKPLRRRSVDGRELKRLLQENGVNNHKDREMVIDSIKFVSELRGKNIVKYSVSLIKENKIATLSQQIDCIRHIGSKLTSLFLRDLVFLYRLDDYLSDEDEMFCQPVDTWVRQVAVKLGIVREKERDTNVIQARIVEESKKHKVSSLLFNAGAWYVGARAFDLFLETL